MSNELWDTHAHILSEYYSDIEKIINDACKKEVKYIINSAVDKKTCEEVIYLAEKHKNIYATIGIHPEYAQTYNKEDIEYLKNNINNKKVLAIGEIGLDYHYEGYNKVKQIKLFEVQLKLAEEYNMPVVIHSRDATNDTIKILKKYKVKGVIHSFTGSYETANEYINLGYKLGINGVLTFKNCNLKETLKKINLENIVLETDSPYLTPSPNRGKENNPSNIIHIANFLEEIYSCDLSKISHTTTNNVRRIFDKIN